MARVSITLYGRNYTVACEDGQEARLAELVDYVDDRLRALGAKTPNANEAQLLVLVSLLLADEVFDLYAMLDEAGAVDSLTAADASEGAQEEDFPADAEADAEEEEPEEVDEAQAMTMVDALQMLARRIEDIAARLERA